MGRYADLYRELYKREPTDFPKPFNKLIKIGKKYRLKILTEPRNVVIPYGRKAPIIEVSFENKRYTLYLSLVDLHNRMAMLEKQEETKAGKQDFSLVNRWIVLKQKSPRRFQVELEPKEPLHQY